MNHKTTSKRGVTPKSSRRSRAETTTNLAANGSIHLWLVVAGQKYETVHKDEEDFKVNTRSKKSIADDVNQSRNRHALSNIHSRILNAVASFTLVFPLLPTTRRSTPTHT